MDREEKEWKEAVRKEKNEKAFKKWLETKANNEKIAKIRQQSKSKNKKKKEDRQMLQGV